MKIKASKSAGKASKAAASSSSSTPFSFASPPPSSSNSSIDYRAQSAAIPLPASDMKLHGGSPLKNPAPTVKCPDCGKPVLRAAIGDHAVNCQRIRDGLQPESTTTSNDFSHRSDNGGDDHHSNYGGSNKKRRLSDVSMSTSTPPPSSKKSKPTPSTGPPSLVPERPSPAPSGSEAGTSSVGGVGGSNWAEVAAKKEKSKSEKKGRREADKKMGKDEPLDLDRRCGVINDKNTPCLRSLTCKSHGMGPKREVQGRSKPFDVLLLEWNRVNNPRFLEPKQPRKNAAAEFYSNHFQNGGNGFGNGGGNGGMGGGKGGKRSGGRKTRGRDYDEDSFDGSGGGGGGRSSPESELKSLVAAAKASRARLSAPLPSSPSTNNSFAFAFTNNNGGPLSAVPSSFRTGGTLAAFGGGGSGGRGGGGMLMGGIPREGWKGSLYGRRRETLTALDRSLRAGLGVK